MKKTEDTYLMNRELSWLKFNDWALDEAGNSRVPLAEMLGAKFKLLANGSKIL